MKSTNNKAISRDIAIKVQELKMQHQEQVNKCLSAHGVFWAFSNQQFAEGKTPLEEGDKYVSIGAGGYMPKSKVDNMLAALKVINKKHRQDIKRVNGSVEEIIAAVNNYEGNIEDTVREFEGIYTRDYIIKVCSLNAEMIVSF